MSKCEKSINLNNLLNTEIGSIPALKSLQDQTESIFTDIRSLDVHDVLVKNCMFEKEYNLEKCYFVNLPQRTTELNLEHDPFNGKFLGFKETLRNLESCKSAKDSMSLNRLPCQQSIRGQSTNAPFWPGGFDVEEMREVLVKGSSDSKDQFQFKELLTIPPDFDEGIKLETKCSDFYNFDLIQNKKSDSFSKKELKNINSEQVEKEEGVEDQVDLIVEKGKEKKIFKKNEIENIETKKLKEENEFVVVVDVSKPVLDFHKRIPNPVKKYPFELDTFQKEAIIQMEFGHNVFVAAHTSAGKTVVAEYAIALCLNHFTQAIYTSPIKALSNQKFREFRIKFEDVGLITGDFQVNPSARTLIMTTEILRSMLYNGSDVIRDLEWVIFDEVHYINDPERGVVWEEVLILLPDHVKIVMLSATVPNSKEFAEWVGRIKRKRVYVISTSKRPVPLEHFLYTGVNVKLKKNWFLILDSERKLRVENYNKAMEAVNARASKNTQAYGSRNKNYNINIKQEQQMWISLIKELDKMGKTPAIGFIFSKRRIDENSESFNCLDLLSKSEKHKVSVFFKSRIQTLSSEDQTLPQIHHLYNLLTRGLAVHHSGILPILKEIVEILFQDGLVKVLFATETFAMGVNMPAKTVVFDAIQKHDKEKMRDLLAGEYIQMAGRAGRRGLDDTGTVIILVKNELPELSDLHKMMLGPPTTLTSQFKLSYLLILTLLKFEKLSIQNIIRRSFCELKFLQNSKQMQAKVEALKIKLEEKEKKIKQFSEGSNFEHLKRFYDIVSQYYDLKQELKKKIENDGLITKILKPGQVVQMEKVGSHDNVVAVVLALLRNNKLQIFVNCDFELLKSIDKKTNNYANKPIPDYPKPYIYKKHYSTKGDVTGKCFEVSFTDISIVTNLVLKINCTKILEDVKKKEIPRFKEEPPTQSTQQLIDKLMEISGTHSQSLSRLDITKELKSGNLDIADIETKLRWLEQESLDRSFTCLEDPLFLSKFEEYKEKRKLKDELDQIIHSQSDEALHFLPEYYQRVEVLRHFKFITRRNNISLKGKVAYELNVQELLITELIFRGYFNHLEVEVIAAMLSCFVFQQSRCQKPNLNKKLTHAKKIIEKVASELDEIERSLGVEGQCGEGTLQFGLMEVTFEWTRGMKFSDIVKLTDVQEGVIVKTIQRLNELFLDLIQASSVIGDPTLKMKMEEGSKLIKRNIVFSASLYLLDI